MSYLSPQEIWIGLCRRLCWKYDLKIFRIALQNNFDAKLTIMSLAGFFSRHTRKTYLLIYYNRMHLIYVSSSIFYVVAEYANSVDLITLGIVSRQVGWYKVKMIRYIHFVFIYLLLLLLKE